MFSPRGKTLGDGYLTQTDTPPLNRFGLIWEIHLTFGALIGSGYLERYPKEDQSFPLGNCAQSHKYKDNLQRHMPFLALSPSWCSSCKQNNETQPFIHTLPICLEFLEQTYHNFLQASAIPWDVKDHLTVGSSL